ncbi:MAG TPA: ABC transporter permease [Actinophytocola sp.]|uniref:ABC transporter permease n=1 Tax=Actinophytocola sp. TaxID=1872138 RepID=UPI002DDDA080|nr:ABC transporter permease [Actinophytocola sp.]HEV2784478.1 ABC transporter permease [Actinophytocola sp.]
MSRQLIWLMQRWLVLLGAVVVWELAARAAKAYFLPPPTAIAEAGFELWFTGPASHLFLTDSWFENILPSLGRILGGFLIAAVIGVALGAALGRSRTGMDYVGPLFAFMRAIPPVTLIPVFIGLFGIDHEMKLATIVFGAVWPVLLNTVDGVRSVDPVQTDTARSFRTSRSQWVTMVVLPAALPKIFAGLRLSLSIAVLLMVVSELVGRSGGIGSELIFAQRQFDPTIMWAWIVLLGIVGYVLNTLFLIVERRVLAWQPSRHTEHAMQAGG